MITFPEIAESTKNESIRLIENYFSGQIEAPISFLNLYCRVFNINPGWLKSNKGTPFGHFKNFFREPHNAASFISAFSPHKIYFVKSKSEYAHFCIVLEKSNDYAILSNDSWMVSDKTGRGGQGQTTSLYVLLKFLKAGKYLEWSSAGKKWIPFNLNSSIYGAELETDDALNQLLDGNTHAQCLNHMRRYSFSYWWDDFMDLKRTVFSKERYRNMYGNQFVLAQEIVDFTMTDTMPSCAGLIP